MCDAVCKQVSLTNRVTTVYVDYMTTSRIETGEQVVRGFAGALRTVRLMTMAHGPAGWVEVRWHLNDRELAGYIRLAFDRTHGRYVAAELRLLDPTPEALRSLPLVKIIDAVNASDNIAVHVAQHLRDPAPKDLVRYFEKARSGTGPVLPLEREFRLSRPSGRRLPDDFYEQVARAYTEAVAYGLNPRKTLAADSGTPADTVARWISEARKRGYLPPGQPGRITALSDTLRAARAKRERRTHG